MANEEIKMRAKQKGVALWKIADALGISEPTFSRWLRHALSEEREQRVNAAIESLSGTEARQ